jgi:hypothetical protein
MNHFEESKADILSRLPALRFMNAIGMIAWQADGYGSASQKLRMLHPLSWPWAVAVVLVAIVAHGIIEVWKELKTVWRTDCVWW